MTIANIIIITVIPALGTPHYHGEFALPAGKESRIHFLWIRTH